MLVNLIVKRYCENKCQLVNILHSGRRGSAFRKLFHPHFAG